MKKNNQKNRFPKQATREDRPLREPDFQQMVYATEQVPFVVSYWWPEMLRVRGREGKCQKLFWDEKKQVVGIGVFESKHDTGEPYLSHVRPLDPDAQKCFLRYLTGIP